MAENGDCKLLEVAVREHLHEQVLSTSDLPAHASQRRMFRLKTPTRSIIGILNQNQLENDAFIQFSRHFRKCGLPVPEILYYSRENCLYLEQDLGEKTLFDVLSETRTEKDPFPQKIENLYKVALDYLPRFQVDAGKTVDYGWCFQDRVFNAHSILKDTAAFRTEFLARTDLKFDDTALQSDFSTLASYLAKAHADFFLYRDFQTRNIMIEGDAMYFIDYQTGRRGALQYDVVSLLYQSSAMIPDSARERLLSHYLTALAKHIKVDQGEFRDFYYGFVVARMVQVLGVYGRKGLGDGHPYFKGNIKPAIETLRSIVDSARLSLKLPELSRIVSTYKV